MNRDISIKTKGLKMALAGAGGVIINEVYGIISGEIMTTFETSKLPKGYFQKGLGHFLGDKKLINQGRKMIHEYRERQSLRNKMFERLTN